ncbi:hypothetical protein HYD72_03650 [Mycoplasmopsis bovis]|nr:hypothetical protein [Mycoplasmopsis bovis]QQH25658.1 hypothetical protein HYE15_03630 [Mycoplasmopsis bovis]QQH49376.1 hypothetical protein HYD72_03650 [Mycoplasmopsis bovis]
MIDIWKWSYKGKSIIHLTKQKAPQVNLRRFLLPFVKIWVSKLKKRKAFTLYMISNDKNTSYSTDLCLLKKKLNVHGKYKFNYVHYVIDETNWEWNIDQVKSQNQ